MDKMEQIILSIDNNRIFKNASVFEWFKKDNIILSNILNNLEWVRRWDAEVDFTKKQPLPYGVLYNKELDAFWLYKRADNTKGGKNWESRLNNKYSLGVWGHVEKKDLTKDTKNILDESLIREVEEEIDLKGSITGVEYVGLINSSENDVSKVHLGILYIISTDAKKAIPIDWEIAFWEFVKRDEILERVKKDNGDLENWSKIILNNF